MPITKSAKKAFRQNKKKKARNLIYKNKIKTLMKKGLTFASEGKQEELKQLLPSIYKALDKAAKVGVIKKNTAAHRKSRLAKFLTLGRPAERIKENKVL